MSPHERAKLKKFSLRRGTAARSEGEALQGDVDGVNREGVEEPHEHPPPSLTLGHPLRRGNWVEAGSYTIILSKSRAMALAAVVFSPNPIREAQWDQSALALSKSVPIKAGRTSP